MRFPLYLVAAVVAAFAAPGCLVDHPVSVRQSIGELASLMVARPDQPTQSLAEQPHAVALPTKDKEPLGTFDLTYYWIATENSDELADTELFNPSCTPIAAVSRSFAEKVALEGTGRTRQGRIINSAGACRCDFSPCFFFTSRHRPWGVGVGKRPLSPFRSVAVDPARVPIGGSVYIQEFDGLFMPGNPPWGGFVHDGCVIADDRGGGVRGMQIDFFTGRQRDYRALMRDYGIKRVTVFSGETRCESDAI
jgi:3D (Asp-Asp-Asp) domain-containing protein